MTISRKICFSSSAVSASTGRLSAMTPPKMDTGSPALALRKASASDASEVARPHGLVCLMATAVVSLKSSTVLKAASASRMLLNESCLPWICVARATDGTPPSPWA